LNLSQLTARLPVPYFQSERVVILVQEGEFINILNKRLIIVIVILLLGNLACDNKFGKNGTFRLDYEFGGWEEQTYQNGVLNGPYKIFSEEDKLIAEGFYKEGKFHGIEKQYYKSGKISSVKHYVNGESEGILRQYYESGELKAEINFHQGKIDGEVKEYFQNGDIKKIQIFKENKLVE